ncbi:hypothetical protein OIDMADRAFT_120800 [Oidiodendron maius Zn]|uniref:Replication termination factor 2 n=1 Tax=Oidiodendron maius (strain Zn) TaxID=913774 RepID=A0A0C3H1Y8_OIDMZ|nr:hypothetical protein OIDMADRAFT_120800 [Oidiodendron maius Zn]
MGNDGGSIPTRRELVKSAARNPNTTELKATQHEAQTHAWTQCPLSNRPLVEPIVSDCAGTLYNKDAILEHLLPQDESIPKSLVKEQETLLNGCVKGLRDVVEVKFTTTKDGKKICPITIRELSSTTTCTECNEPYETENVIPILPLAQEDVTRLADRVAKLRTAGLTHSLRKAPGGKKKRKNADAEAPAVEVKANGEEYKEMASITQPRNGPTTISSGIKNAATASLTSKVLEEQEARNKTRKLDMNDNLKTLFSKSKYDAQSDFMTRGFSIPKRA